MKIKGKFEYLEDILEYIEFKDNSNNSYIIKAEDIDVIDNEFQETDAEIMGDIDDLSEIEFIYNNFASLVEDANIGPLFSRLELSDNMGIITIDAIDDEDHPGKRTYQMTANFFNERNKKIIKSLENDVKKNENVILSNGKSEKPDLTDAILFSDKEIETFSNSLTPDDYASINQEKAYIPNTDIDKSSQSEKKKEDDLEL